MTDELSGPGGVKPSKKTVVRGKLFREARNLGFVHVKRERTSKKDDEIFLAEFGNRQLHLCIHKDGKGEVAHSVSGWDERKMNAAPPTTFKDLPGMYRAIAFEWQRETTEAPKDIPIKSVELPAAAPTPWGKP